MDENEDKSGGRFYNYRSSLFLKNIRLQLHLLLPIALLLTLITSYNYNYYYLSAFVFPLLAHTFEKKYMFLLCTTILTFITKHLGFKETIHHDKQLLYLLSELENAPVLEWNISTQQVQEYEYGDEVEVESEEAYERKTESNEVLVVEGEEDDGGVFEEEEEYAETNNMNTEELNKKIEEFIKKMREDLRVEAES